MKPKNPGFERRHVVHLESEHDETIRTQDEHWNKHQCDKKYLKW